MGKHFVRLMYRGKDVLLPSVKQMDQLDGWRNVKKWRANNARLGIDKRALEGFPLFSVSSLNEFKSNF